MTMKYINTYEGFVTPSKGVTNLNSFVQASPNGIAGTTDPAMDAINPDDKLEVVYKRIARDMNPSNKVMWKKSKRRWRKRREETRNLKKSQ